MFITQVFHMTNIVYPCCLYLVDSAPALFVVYSVSTIIQSSFLACLGEMCFGTFHDRDRWCYSPSSTWWWSGWTWINIVIDHLFIQRAEEYMISIIISQILCWYIVSFNNTVKKYTQINTPLPTVSDQLLLKLDIIAPYSILLINGTTCIILYICWYWLRAV